MTKISNLPQDTSPSTDDITITVDTTNGQAKKVTLSDLITLINTSGAPLSSNFNNPYKFSAYRNAALTYGSPAIVTYDTELFDTNNNFDVTTNKGRYTVPVAGFYWFGACCSVNANASGFEINLYKNGSQLMRGDGRIQSGGSWNNNFIVTGLIQLAANDYVEISFYGSGQACVTGALATYFQGFLVSKT